MSDNLPAVNTDRSTGILGSVQEDRVVIGGRRNRFHRRSVGRNAAGGQTGVVVLEDILGQQGTLVDGDVVDQPVDVVAATGFIADPEFNTILSPSSRNIAL